MTANFDTPPQIFAIRRVYVYIYIRIIQHNIIHNVLVAVYAYKYKIYVRRRLGFILFLSLQIARIVFGVVKHKRESFLRLSIAEGFFSFLFFLFLEVSKGIPVATCGYVYIIYQYYLYKICIIIIITMSAHTSGGRRTGRRTRYSDLSIRKRFERFIAAVCVCLVIRDAYTPYICSTVYVAKRCRRRRRRR